MYRSILQESWHCERPGYLSPNETELMFLADAPDPDTWKEYKAEVLAMFERTDDGHYFHPRVIGDYQRLIEKHLAKATAGQKGGVAKAQLKHSHSTARTVLEQKGATASPEHSSSIKKQIQEPSTVLEQSHEVNSNSKTNGNPAALNATEVGWALCKREGWSGKTIPLALSDAITHVADGNRSPDFQAVGEDLVLRWHEHKATAKFPHDPGVYFSGAHYEKDGATPPPQLAPGLITDTKKYLQDMLDAERALPRPQNAALGRAEKELP
jgi:uncharacterized protein YdaU (DUF1376 family)